MSTGAHLHVQRSGDLPIVDIGPLLDPASTAQAATSVATEIDRACREIGFFGITGHGVDPMLQDQLERSSREFFALDDEVKAALESLPEQFRMAVLLADVEGFAYKEIAEILDIPIGTVMSRLHRGRKGLQKKLYEFAVERGLVA